MGWKSRKLWIAIIVMFISILLPIIYQKSGVSESITMVVLAVVGSVGVIYGGLNILETKFGKKE